MADKNTEVKVPNLPKTVLDGPLFNLSLSHS